MPSPLADPAALNARRLRPARSIECRTLPDGVRLMKQTDRGRYLALTPAQQRVFDRFQGDLPVQDVLRAVLTEGAGLRLRGFYDLVCTALADGFLVGDEPAPGAGSLVGRRWPVGWSPAVGIGLAAIMLGLGVAAFRSAPLVLPQDGAGWIEAAVAAALSLSLGGLLAGCVLSGAGRQVYRPRLHWAWGIPCFTVDGRDAFMAGRGCEAAVALQRLAAPFLAGAVAWWLGRPAGLFGSLVAALVASCPFGDSPAHGLLHAVFRRAHQLPRTAARFLRHRLIPRTFHWRERLVEERYLVLYATYAVVWMVVVGRVAHRCLDTNARTLVSALRQPSGSLGDAAAALGLAALVAAIAAPLVFVLWIVLRALWRAVAARWFRAEAALGGAAADRPSPAEIDAFLERTLLFSQLSPADRQAVAAELSFVNVAAGATVIRQGDEGDVLGIVYAGGVEVVQETEAGDTVPLGRLGPGDVFGEIALLDRVPRTSSVRCTVPTSLLVLSRSAFERLLVGTLGAGTIRTTVQVCGFLRRHPLFADWPSQGLMRLAGSFTDRPVAPGEQLIRAGEPNDSFLIVREGRLEARIDGRAVTTLGPGDFCGEISLLQGGPATADVVALERGSCLRLGREPFLDLVSRSVLTGFVLEDTAESRLRRAAPP